MSARQAAEVVVGGSADYEFFVANSGDNTVSVLKKGLVVDTITLSAGYEPRAFAQNQATGDIYVLSRSSRIRYDDNYLPKLVCEQPAVTVLSYD